MEEELETPETPNKNLKAGERVRAARLAAGMEVERLAVLLRISPSVLEDIEACRYDKLPGDPYVRAMLGSLARTFNLDSKKLLQAYNTEIGNKSEEPAAKPYKDTSHVHILAHRKLFIGLLAVLLLALLVILGKVSSSSSDQNEGAETAPPRTDTVALAVPPDTLPESAALVPDSLKSDSMAAVAKTDTVAAKAEAKLAAKAKVDSLAKATALAKLKADSLKTAASKADTAKAAASGMNRVTVKPLMDSVWMRVLRNGKPEEVILLRQSKPPVEVAHTDTIVLILGKRNSVEITLGETTLVPAKKRFKLIGNKIIYF